MKGYDSLQNNGLPTAPPPYSSYNQSTPYPGQSVGPVINVTPQREQPVYYPSTAIHMMRPAHNTNINVRQGRECCCCCCSCPFWVCLLMIALIILLTFL